MTHSTDYDVVVIGAGISGLSAAYHLTCTIPGCKVVVLEAKDRVGGRTLTVPMKAASGPDDWDLGGQWVCRTQHHVLWLLKELGIEQYSQLHNGTKLQQTGDNGKIRTYEGDIPSLPLHVLLDLLRLEWKADSLAKSVPYDTPWKAPAANHYDSITFEQLLARETWTKGARDLVEAIYDTVNGVRGRGHSALNYLFYLHSGISNKSLYECKDGGAQENKIKGGAQTVSNKLVEKLGSSSVLLSEPVVSIDQSEGMEGVIVKTLSGRAFHSKYVINAIPLNCEASVQYLPDAPVKRQVLIGYSQIGHLLKFIATYKTAFWREKGYSGEILNCTSQSPTEGRYAGPLNYVTDATSCNGNPALVGFINNSIYWSEVDSEKRKEAILNHLATFLGNEAKSPIDFRDKDWAREPYNGGCPVNVMMPGALQYWDSIREPFNRVHWAGTETATQWNGYLSGAVQSGLRAADEVAARLYHGRHPVESDLLKSLDDLGHKDRQPRTGRLTLGISAMHIALLVVAIGIAWILLFKQNG